MPILTQEMADKAAAISGPYTEAVAKVRNNPDLTPEAKQRQVAGLWSDASAQMDKLRESWLGDSKATTTSLNQDVFGSTPVTGANAISVRDADDRAAQLTSPSEALALLQRAEANSDDVLARAIAQRAWSTRNDFFADKEWTTSVLETYVSTHPDTAEKINALYESEQADKNDFHNAGHFIIFEPDEVRGLSFSDRSALVGGA